MSDLPSHPDTPSSQPAVTTQRWFLTSGTQAPLTDTPKTGDTIRCMKCEQRLSWHENIETGCPLCGSPHWRLPPLAGPLGNRRLAWLAWCAWLADHDSFNSSDELTSLAMLKWEALDLRHYLMMQAAIQAVLDKNPKSRRPSGLLDSVFLPSPGEHQTTEEQLRPAQRTIEIALLHQPTQLISDLIVTIPSAGEVEIRLQTNPCHWAAFQVLAILLDARPVDPTTKSTVLIGADNFRIGGSVNLLFSDFVSITPFSRQNASRPALRHYPYLRSPNIAMVTLHFQGSPGEQVIVNASILVGLMAEPDPFSNQIPGPYVR